jgi:hypothetical protein
MAVIFWRNVPRVEVIDAKDFDRLFGKTRPLTLTFHNRVFVPALNFWREKVVVGFFKKLSRLISKSRFAVRGIEKWLSGISDYLNGKTIQKSDTKSEYWSDVNGFKEDLNKE